ncbi:efflux RND transporter periplasmic adaptor subunit [Sunxiuqinia rutila]|uniref:efflux RND transporter periplasmic adaptor subunit n=1 Tax=Sunxiuqinia rutila TaxID=1397841 RepID=UPI003D367166
MKKFNQYIQENYKFLLGALVVGLFLGWVFFHSSAETASSKSLTEGHEGHDHESDDPTTWTCSMHPQIQQEKPGDCPICGMDLIPLASMNAGGEDIDPNEIQLSESAASLANVQTSRVVKAIPKKTIHMQGKVEADERKVSELTARFGGRIEKLFVNFTGQQVRQGEKLATIYSPELLAAQRELMEAMSYRETRPGLYRAARNKLKLWDLTDAQIDTIEASKTPQQYFDVLSPISGTVNSRNVAIGDYVKEGQQLFKLIDLSKLWVMFDAYENDLPWIKAGDEMEYTIQALPGETFTGKVRYIDPFIDPTTRVAKVRLELNNTQQKVKPGMFSSGVLESSIANEAQLLVPKSAILWTGKRAVVYVKVPNRETPSFLYREIVLGPVAGDSYVVADGLHEGEEIATNGVFKIDASAQLRGLQSMMNPDGGMGSTGHQHGDMNMGANAQGEHAQFKAAGNCEMCKDRIEKAALAVNGVFSAHWDAEQQLVHLQYDSKKTNPEKVQQAIANAGHDTEKFKAPDSVYNELPECCLFDRLSYTAQATTSAKEEHAHFKASGNCEMCKDRIEKAALAVGGVSSAQWNAEEQMIHLQYDPKKTSPDKVQLAIAKAGHDTEEYKAPDAVYNDLPECCLYREE